MTRFRILNALGFGHSARARTLEAEGRLEEAFAEYARDDAHDDARRVALALADASDTQPQRVFQLGRALAHAGEADRRELTKRYQRARLDLAKGSARPALMRAELQHIGAALEAIEDWEGAADAFRAVGDADAEARVLTAAGEIERLEAMLASTHRVESASLRLRELTGRIVAFDRAGQRRAALVEAAPHRAVAEIDRLARRIEQARCAGPRVKLEVGGEVATWVLGPSVLLGRSREADVQILAPTVARKHAVIERAGDAITLHDLGSTGGTWLAGARLDGPIPIPARLDLRLGEVPVAIDQPHDTLRIAYAGQIVRAPFGDAPIGPFLLRIESGAGGPWARLVARPGGPPPLLDDLACAEGVDLAVGDEIRAERGGPIVARVVA